MKKKKYIYTYIYNVNVKNEIKLKKVAHCPIDFLQFADGASIPGIVYEPSLSV